MIDVAQVLLHQPPNVVQQVATLLTVEQLFTVPEGAIHCLASFVEFLPCLVTAG